MLVVVTIMMILVAAAATTFRPAGESRRIREAARSINVYLGSARNRAMETGRPCGVVLRRFSANLPCAMTLEQCEVPPCYGGDTEDAMATVQASVPVSGIVTVTATFTPTNSFAQAGISAGDLIQFNCQGPLYQIIGVSGSTSLTATIDVSQGQSVPWPTTGPSLPVPYRIYRSPTSGAATIKSAVRTLQLPASTVIDLEWSGKGVDPSGADVVSFGSTGADVYILFAPNGSVDRVYSSAAGLNGPITEPLFLLVGKRERTPYNLAGYDASNPDTFANWQDLNNLWVVVNPQTGLITTSEVAATPDPAATTGVPKARILAKDAQSMGGK